MSTSLLELVRLTHRILDFMIHQPADQLSAFAAGRCRLTLVPTEDPEPVDAREPAAAPPAAVSAPPQPAAAVAEDPQPAAAGEPPRAATPRRSARNRTAAMPLTPETAAGVAERLRRCVTVAEGLEYLETVATTNADRKAIGRALDIAGVSSMKKDDLVKQILQHAIGARLKFAGLSSW